MIPIAAIVVASTALGVAADRRSPVAARVSRACLSAMLYGLIPFVAFVNFAHLSLDLGAGVGLLAGYAGLGLAAALAGWVGRRIGLSRASQGALILAVLLANTGYLGYPATVALLGHRALIHAVAYDQIISGPMVFTVGFAIGAAFGGRPAPESRVAHVDAETDIALSGAASPGSRSVRRRIRALLLNPPLWAALAGLIGGPGLAPRALVHAADLVVDAFLVLGFFAVGVALSSERREDGGSLLERPDRAVLSAVALRFSVNPALLGLLALSGVAIPSAYLLQAAMPSGINGLIVAHAYRLDQRLAATAIVWSTLVWLVVVAIVALL